MPKVTTYGGQKVGKAPLPAGYRQGVPSPEAFGSGLGATIAGLAGQQIADIAQRGRDQADETFGLQYSNTVDHWRNERLYNPETGALNAKGQAALGLPKTVMEEFDQFASSEAAKMATNPRQRQIAERIRLQARGQLDATILRHTAEQMEAFTLDELNAKVENVVNNAVANYSDPVRIAQERANGIAAIAEVGATLGIGKEALEQRTLKMTTAMHVGVIKSLLQDSKAEAAEAYFAHVKDEIAGDMVADVKSALEAGSLLARSQASFDKILSEGGTLADQRAKAKALADPKERDQVLGYLEHEEQVTDRAQLEKERADQLGFYNRIDARPSLRSAMNDPIWQTLSLAERSGVRAYIKARTEGVGIATDRTQWYALMVQSFQDPATFAKTNLLQFKGVLSDGDFEQMVNRQAAVAKDQNSHAGAEQFFTNKQVIDQSLTSFGIDPTPKEGTPAAKALAEFNYVIGQRVAQWQGANGGKLPTNADLQSIVDQTLLNTAEPVAKGWFFNTPATLGGKVGDVGAIPPAELQKLKAALVRNSVPVTNENILRYWYLAQSQKQPVRVRGQ